MEYAGFSLALIGFLLAAGVWLRSVKKEEERAKLESELEKERERAKSLSVQADKASTRIGELEKDLADAVARRDEKAMAAAMWELELERSYRQWKDIIAPGKVQDRGEVNSGQQLAFAIGQDVERLREEVGVSIRFDGNFDLELEPEVALGMLRIGEELLALAAKQSDEVSVSIDQDEDPAISLKVDCLGWEHPTRIEDDELGRALERMASKLDGDVKRDYPAEDQLNVSVRLPAPAFEVP